MNKRKTLEAEMILFSCCIFLEKSWVHNTTQQLLVLGTQHQLMKLWMLVVGYTTTNCTKVGCWVHNNQQISDVVLFCVGSCWYNPCLQKTHYFGIQRLHQFYFNYKTHYFGIQMLRQPRCICFILITMDAHILTVSKKRFP